MGEGIANTIYFAYGSNMCPEQMAARCPGGPALGRLVGFRMDSLNRSHVDGGREEGDDCVEKRLHTLVLEGAATEDRNQLLAQGGLSRAFRSESSATVSPAR